MILVTGATGFLGAELIHQLTQQGTNVVALKRKTSVIPQLLIGNPLIKWMVADINDIASLEDVFKGITQVYHCAALVSFNPKDKAALLRVNIEGTGNVVNLCQENHIRMLHVSSVAALGNAKKGMQITENDYWVYEANVHSYAISKYEGEMEVWRGITEGLDAVIVNPSVIIGANAGFGGSGAIFRLVKNGLSFYTKGASGFVDVRDVAFAMIALMNRTAQPADGESGERFILSAGNYTYQDFFSAIAKGFGIKAPAKEAKPWMMGIAWRAAKLASIFTGKPAALTSDAAKSSLTESLYSNDKIKNTIGMKFRPLEESIADVCAALKTRI